MKYKNDIIFAFKNYKSLREKQPGYYSLKILSKNEGEKYKREFQEYFEEEGITHEISTFYSQKQNRIAKRPSRIIMRPV